MSQTHCQILGCQEPASEEQVELRVPLDPHRLSEETVRARVCSDHRRRFADAGLEIRELTLSQ